jgi:two-component system, LytTR family, response regulator
MKAINALLVDDEIGAINTLRGMLNQYFPQINIVAEARSVGEALTKLERHGPDLVFLDVEMPPYGSGFDFLEKSKDYHFGVIFVTAYEEYAVQAINAVQPWGYLVKPINITGLAKAVETAFQKINEAAAHDAAIPETQSIIIPDARKGNVVIRVRDIVYCQAAGTATDIYFEKNAKMIRMTASRPLKEIEDQLPTSHFCRSHHSFLVNLDWVDRYIRTGRNGVIYLRNGAKSPISIGKMNDFEEHFNQFIHFE